jgi:hypothetical protein
MIVGNIVVFGWPVVVAILFARYDIPKAIVASLIFGYLFLPERVNFNLPILPTLDKHSVPALAALVFVLMSGEKTRTAALPGWIPRGLMPRLLLLIMISSAFLTVMTNGDPLQYGPLYLPALRPYDAFSSVLSILVGLTPFFLARKYLAHPEQQKTVLVVFVAAGFIYSFLALFEVRMSPQLNNMVYGFFPHSFLQHVRENGFRPLVFLNHGLLLSIFFTMTVIAAASLSRVLEADQRMKYLGLMLWLLLTLFLSKSLGAFAIALMLVPAALLLGSRLQLIICAVFAVIVLVYPALRGAGWIPVEAALNWAEGVDPERAGSLAFRLINEDVLLARAQERPLFGWGAFGRNGVFNEFGEEVSVTDGYWIIIVGQGGWARYLAEFGLCCLPAIIAAFSARKYQFGPETAGLMLLLTANLVDLLPNDSLTPLTWLVVGAVWGRIELGYVSKAQEDSKPVPSVKPKLAYTRFGKEAATKRV